MALITCVEDQRQIAKRKVPKMFYDYADTGSWTESTYNLNEKILRKLDFVRELELTLVVEAPG